MPAVKHIIGIMESSNLNQDSYSLVSF
jgi:dynein heavy chain